MHIGWPQGIFTGLIFVGVGVSLARYGKPKADSYGIFDVVVSPSVVLGLLYWGGFFTAACQ